MSNKDFQNGFALGLASGGVVEQEYILPVGGEELGGVKNGGNVVINEDGTMTAPKPEVTNEQVSSAVSEYLTENPFDSSGWSVNAKNLLITVLRNSVYSTDQSENITALKTELAVTEEPDIPDEPIAPEVTLSDISATYSGGDVTVGTAVTDLTGIVVTATYSDGSTQTVTDYTLSGEIAEGSNIITVSYGGKTTTFNVTGVTESGGERVAMTKLVEHNNVANIGFYSDGGSTAYSDSRFPGTNIKTILSENVFETDTTLKITVTPTAQIFQCYLFCSTLLDETRALGANDSDDLFFHIKPSSETFAYGWSTTAHEFTYTVKAGYKFGIVLHQSANGPFTVEVV